MLRINLLPSFSLPHYRQSFEMGKGVVGLQFEHFPYSH